MNVCLSTHSQQPGARCLPVPGLQARFRFNRVNYLRPVGQVHVAGILVVLVVVLTVVVSGPSLAMV